MRLINTKTLKLIEVFENEAMPYVALSHTWGMNGTEVSFQEMHSGQPNVNKQGYRKIEQFCKQVALDGNEFTWVDTCCMFAALSR